MSSEEAPKYAHLLEGDDDQDDEPDEEEAPASPTTLDSQAVTVRFDPAGGEEQFVVYVGHGDYPFTPFVSHADRYHRLDEGSQWDPDGTPEWADIPRPVQQRVVDAVAGVDEPVDLAPTSPTGGRDA